VCTKSTPRSELIVDVYFLKLLKDVGESVKEVELLKDGTWRVVQEDPVENLTERPSLPPFKVSQTQECENIIVDDDVVVLKHIKRMDFKKSRR